MPLNKWYVFLLFTTQIFAQQEINNFINGDTVNDYQQYIDDPKSVILWKMNPMDCTYTKRIQTNALIFSNETVQYHMDFVFYYDEQKQLLLTNGIEFRLTLYSKATIFPYDLLDQTALLSIRGLTHLQWWNIEFDFSVRELQQIVHPNGLTEVKLAKFISQDELDLLKLIWSTNPQGSTFILKGYYGVLEFFYPQKITDLYLELFKDNP